MNYDHQDLEWFKLLFGSVPTLNGRPRQNLYQLMKAQARRIRRNQVMHHQSWLKIVMMTLCQTSTETYRGKRKQVRVLHQCHPRRRNQVMHQQSPLKIVMMTLCQTSAEIYCGKKVLTTLCTVSDKHYVVSY